MAHRRALEGAERQHLGGKAERAHIGGHVRQPERARQVAEIREQPRPVGPLDHVPVPLLRQAGGDEVPGLLPGLVDGGDAAVACAGQRAGALDDLLEHRVEVESGADAQAGRAQRGDALAQRFDFAGGVVFTAHLNSPPRCRWQAKLLKCAQYTRIIRVMRSIGTPISHIFVYPTTCNRFGRRAGPGACVEEGFEGPRRVANARPAACRVRQGRLVHGVSGYGRWPGHESGRSARDRDILRQRSVRRPTGRGGGGDGRRRPGRGKRALHE